MFTQSFGRFVCIDDTIACNVNGFDIEARIVFDHDTSPRDYDQEGYCFDTSDPDHGEENARIIEAWERDEWFYCGVVLSVFRNGITLSAPAASLWGIECNFPKSDNSYLRTIANELLGEALDKARAKLQALCAA